MDLRIKLTRQINRSEAHKFELLFLHVHGSFQQKNEDLKKQIECWTNQSILWFSDLDREILILSDILCERI